MSAKRTGISSQNLSGAIVVLGWGSLLWDRQFPEFDASIAPWLNDGPGLPLEFTRISESRAGALTLVIDQTHGVVCGTACAVSSRSTLREAAEDLRVREGTIQSRIGTLDVEVARTDRLSSVSQIILDWAAPRRIRGVVWTALHSNFEEKRNAPFSVAEGMKYLATLPAPSLARAQEYINLAPPEIDTPLRRALQRRGMR